MIPKIIHFVWVGGKPLNEMAEKCIASWKKYCPDYEIKRWDESNFDISENKYCKEAYDNKKWAFVSDYIRLRVLYEFGGIYMDTDVEVVKPLDGFLNLPAFSGFESEKEIPTGIIAAEKNNLWIKNLLDDYVGRHFVKEDGTLDYTTNVTLITENTKKQFPNLQLNNTLQELRDVTFFPKDYFCPLSYKDRKLHKTNNTYTIHWFNGSWVPKQTFAQKCSGCIKAICRVLLGKRLYAKIKNKIRKTKKQEK